MKIPKPRNSLWLPHAGLSLMLAALLGPPRASAAEPDGKHWLKDPITGCAVWTEKPSGKEIISWSGGCQDGNVSQALLTHMLRNGG